MSDVFSQIEQLLAVGDEITLSIKRHKSDKLRVVVLTELPVEKSTDEQVMKIRAGLCAPIVLTSTAGELDEGFAQLLKETALERIELNNGFKNTRDKNDEVMAGANKALTQGGKKDVSKPTDKKETVVVAPEKPVGKSLI